MSDPKAMMEIAAREIDDALAEAITGQIDAWPPHVPKLGESERMYRRVNPASARLKATDPGRMLRTFGELAQRVGHLDNTGAPCRIEWDGEHDACGICEAIGAVLAKLRECDLDADDIEARLMPVMRGI